MFVFQMFLTAPKGIRFSEIWHIIWIQHNILHRSTEQSSQVSANTPYPLSTYITNFSLNICLKLVAWKKTNLISGREGVRKKHNIHTLIHTNFRLYNFGVCVINRVERLGNIFGYLATSFIRMPLPKFSVVKTQTNFVLWKLDSYFIILRARAPQSCGLRVTFA